jgi:phosphoribosylamine--glycine ligase
MLAEGKFGQAGHRVIIEEFLDGEEFSLLSFVSGQNYVPMPIARDYKRAFDNDAGPNTGGMGAHSPNPLITETDRAEALHNIVEPTISALAAEEIPYDGVLYAGLIKTATGIKVIEFNARFGDPETEVVLPLLKTPLADLITSLQTYEAAETPTDLTDQLSVHWADGATVGVVLASSGYPGDYEKGAPISGLNNLTLQKDIDVYHMGTKSAQNQIVTDGGRVLFIVGQGDTLADARTKAYQALTEISCQALFHRTDIAAHL